MSTPPAGIAYSHAVPQPGMSPSFYKTDIDRFNAAWHAAHCLYRREPRKRWSQQAARNTLTECARHGSALAVMAITAAIANGWQGLVWDRLAIPPNRPKPSGPAAPHAVPVYNKWAKPATEQAS